MTESHGTPERVTTFDPRDRTASRNRPLETILLPHRRSNVSSITRIKGASGARKVVIRSPNSRRLRGRGDQTAR